MKIIQALKEENLRITKGNRWLYWNSSLEQWEVRIHEYRKHNTQLLIETKNEELAIDYLLDKI